MARPSRRALLASLGATVAGLAGCASGDGASSPTDSSTPTATGSPPPTAAATPTSTPRVTTSPGETAASPSATPTDAGTAAGLPTTGPDPAGIDAFDDAVPRFLDEWGIPGASVAVMQDGRLVLARGYGYAGPDTDDPFEPGALCRVGSVSKPITAVAVLDLVERGKLSLDDAAVDRLPDLVPDGGPADPRFEDVTVRHLLQHRSGLDPRQIGFDPVFAPVQVAEAAGTTPPASAETTVEFVLNQDLGFDPGTDYLYANVGYCVLGRIVEAVTDGDYEATVADRVLAPLDADRMHLGATRRENRHPDEVRYLSRASVESPFPDGGTVPRPYGAGVLDEALDADGGWVGSAVDLLRFVRGVDGRDGVADVLDADTRETMLARPDLRQYEDAPQYYATGWLVNHTRSSPFFWHNGSLHGSYGFLAHFEGADVTLAALSNGRSADAQFQRFNAGAQRTLIGAFDSVSAWPDRDLFDRF